MARRDDGKTRALAASRTLNRDPEKVTDPAFAPGSFFDPADLVQVKYEMVRRSETDGVPVPQRPRRRSGSPASAVYGQVGAGRAGPGRADPGQARSQGRPQAHREVVDLLEELLAADATLRSGELAAQAAQRIGISVHPARCERALSRRRRRPGRPRRTARAGDPKSG